MKLVMPIQRSQLVFNLFPPVNGPLLSCSANCPAHKAPNERCAHMNPPSWLSGKELRHVRQSLWLFSSNTPAPVGLCVRRAT